jgi:hypothetical protein
VRCDFAGGVLTVTVLTDVKPKQTIVSVYLQVKPERRRTYVRETCLKVLWSFTCVTFWFDFMRTLQVYGVVNELCIKRACARLR